MAIKVPVAGNDQADKDDTELTHFSVDSAGIADHLAGLCISCG